MNSRLVFKVISLAGSTPFYLATAVGLWFFQSQIAYKLFFSFVALMLVCYGIKLFYRKPRPDAATHPAGSSWFGWLDAASFPSVHSSRAAALAGCVFLLQPTTLVAVLGACFVIAVGMARIKLRRHFLTDVIGGIIIGALVVILARKFTPPVVSIVQAWGR